MRRMNGRNPNFVVVGLVIVVFLLVYKCWTLSSQNDDLSKEIDKFQAELKLSGLKQDQYDKKNQKLQGSIHDLDEQQQKLKSRVEDEEQQLQEAQNSIKSKEYEITKLKNNIIKLQDAEKDLKQQLEDKEGKIEELISDSQQLLTLKNDAEEALSEKDSQINDLKRELEQLQLKVKQSESNKVPPIVPGPFNMPNIGKEVPEKERKESKNQIQEPDSENNLAEQIKSGAVINENAGDHVNNVIPNPPVAAQDPQENHPNGVIEKPNDKPVSGEAPMQEVGNPVLQEPQHQQSESRNIVLQEPFMQQENDENPKKMVLAPPRNKEENLDTAVDDEVKVVEDPSDDQDEEGKEIKKDLENNAGDNYDNYDDDKVDNPHLIKDEVNNGEDNKHEPHGIGAMEIPRHDKRRHDDNIDDVNLDDDIDQRANERVYEGNFDNKIRNLGRL